MRLRVMTALLAASTAVALAAEPPKPPDATLPAPPPPPANYQPSETPEEGAIEPEVTITTKGTEIHEEHRVNGRLYMIKVTPAKGRPYYLIDYEGSGVFRRSELEPDVSVPMWVIKRF
jgi:hypothetical protein